MTMQIFTPEQLRVFRTARFSERAYALQSGLPTVPVRIKFVYWAYNAFYRRTECLFACFVNEDDTTLIGTYYQNALIDFKE